MAGTPKSRLGNYLEGRKSAADKVKKKRKAENALEQRRTPGIVSRQDEMGYVYQNGYDSEDHKTRAKDKNEFRNNVSNFIRGNEFESYDEGYRYNPKKGIYIRKHKKQ